MGSIETEDRLIWTALGNTTNLAARLQALTRSLDVAIVIDSTTRDAIGVSGGDFEAHPGTEIRGRRQVEDVYSLSLRVGGPQRTAERELATRLV